MKKLIEESCLKSTCHPISKIFRTNKLIIQSVWIIGFILSLIGCVYLTGRALISFYQHDIVTKIRVINDNTPDFPLITICNMDPLITENGRRFSNDILNMNDEELRYIDLFSTSLIMSRLINSNLTSEVKDPIGYTFTQGYSCESFEINNCKKESFRWILNGYLGLCYQFNSGLDNNDNKVNISKVSGSGYYNGLEMAIYTGVQNNKSPIGNGTRSKGN
jgi:hypothetical protein